MYSYKTGLGQVWVGSKLPPNPANNIIWLRPSDDHRVLWEIRTYNIYKERWEVLTSAALTAEGLLVLIRDLEKDVKSLQELKVVLYDTVQDLTPEQQQIARQNIGAVSLEDLPFDETITRLAIELTINDEKVYSVVTPLETLTEHYRKFLADPTKYVWQLYLKVGEDQLGLVPLFIVTYGGLHIGFYSPDTSGETKYVSLNTNGDVVIRATVNNYGPTLVEVVQSTGDSTEKVMSQKAVTEELSKKASLEFVTESISVHNTSTIAHADIRELLNTCVGLPAYDSSSYKITFTTLAGATVEIDLPIEQLALRYNAETESIEFDNADGTTTSIPVSAFVKEYVGSIGDRIQISIDENNAIHATVLKNSIDWNCLSVELQERINDHVTSVDFATKAVRTDITQTLSIEAQNQALKNIGADLMIIDIVNGQAVLTEEQEARLLSSKGVILRGTTASPEVLSHIFHSDIQTGDVVGFYSFRKNDYCLTCQYTKSTKTFKVIGNTALRDNSAVVFNREQSLTASQQEQALANLGMKVYVTDSTFLGSTLSAEEIEEVFVSKAILFTDTGDLFSFGAASSSQIYFYKFINRSSIGYITLNKPSGLVSNGSFEYQDINAVHFTAQNPALTSAQQEQAWLNLGLDLVVLKFPEGATSVTLTDKEDAKLAAGAAVLVTVDGTNTSTGVYNADNHIFTSYNFTTVPEPIYYSLWSYTSALYCSYKKASKTFVYNGSLQLNDTGALRTDHQTSLSSIQQSQAFKNLGWKVHVIPQSAINSTDAVSDDEKEARLAATALLVQETGEMYIYGHNSSSAPSDRCFYRFRDTKTLALLNVVTTTGLITQPLFVNIYDENAVSFNIDQSRVSNDRKNKALGNIGADLVRIPYSLLGTTLSDEMANVINNARGIILVDTPNGFISPTIYNKGCTTSSSTKFITIGETKDVYYISYNKNTKALANVVHTYTDTGCVRYVQAQNLTTSEQDKALSNIGLDFVHVDYSLLNTTLDDSTAALVENAKGIILTNTPENYSKAFVFLKSNYFNGLIYFSAWNGVSLVSQFYYNTSTKKLTAISNTDLYFDSIRYGVSQDLTNTQKDMALSNIGLPLVHVDYSLIGSTLDDSTYNKLLTAKGVFLENVPDGDNAPSLYFVGSSNTVTTTFVSEFNARIWFVLTLSHTLKKLSLISTGYASDVVRYGEGQNLTDVQKQQARSNINAVGSSMIKGVEIVYGTAPMQEDNILYIELEETT